MPVVDIFVSLQNWDFLRLENRVENLNVSGRTPDVNRCGLHQGLHLQRLRGNTAGRQYCACGPLTLPFHLLSLYLHSTNQ